MDLGALGPTRLMFVRASEQTGVIVPWSTIDKAIDQHRVCIAPGRAGFIQWEEVDDPDTGERIAIERMLWVDADARGNRIADLLLERWETTVRKRGIKTLIAGARLSNPEAAKSAYERSGFRTTFNFEKDISHVYGT